MTIHQFLKHLRAWHKAHPRIKWNLNHGRFIRTSCNACPMTAIAYSRPRDIGFTDLAGDRLGLSPKDQGKILRAADNYYPYRGQWLRKALLNAVGL